MDASGCVMGITEGRGATRGVMESLRNSESESQWRSPLAVRSSSYTQLEKESSSCIQVARGMREIDRNGEVPIRFLCGAAHYAHSVPGSWVFGFSHGQNHLGTVPAGCRCDTGTSAVQRDGKQDRGERRDEGEGTRREFPRGGLRGRGGTRETRLSPQCSY